MSRDEKLWTSQVCRLPNTQMSRDTCTEVGRNRLALARGTDHFGPGLQRRKVHDTITIPSSMASATRRLLLQSRRGPASITPRSTSKYASQWQRPFSTTPSRSARDPYEERETERIPAKPGLESTWANTPDKAAAQLQKLAADLKELNEEAVQDAARRGRNGREIAMEYELDNDEDLEIAENDLRATKAGFWAEGEESMGPDEDYYGDDITSHGHGELQSHRYLREYARLIAWELPLLSRRLPPSYSASEHVSNCRQNSPAPSSPPQPQTPSASATPRTWANRTRPQTK